MNNDNVELVEIKENGLAGAVGAFLFALVGGLLWYVLWQMGFLASLSGLVGVICAVKGYTIFAKTKKESVKCYVIASIMAVVVLAIAWYLCIGNDIYLAYQEWYAAGEIDFTLTFFESVQAIPFFFISDPSILISYLVDLLFGILFAGLGIFSYFNTRRKQKKAEEQAKAIAAAKAAEEAAKSMEKDFQE